MRKNTKGRYVQHIKPNPEKGQPGKSIKHMPQVTIIKGNLWGYREEPVSFPLE